MSVNNLELLKEMLADEEDLRAKMKLNINEYEVELHQLLQDLGLPAKPVRKLISRTLIQQLVIQNLKFLSLKMFKNVNYCSEMVPNQIIFGFSGPLFFFLQNW